MSTLLVIEVEARQHPIYYVSKAMADADKRYPQLEKLAVARVKTSRKLKLYF